MFNWFYVRLSNSTLPTFWSQLSKFAVDNCQIHSRHFQIQNMKMKQKMQQFIKISSRPLPYIYKYTIQTTTSILFSDFRGIFLESQHLKLNKIVRFIFGLYKFWIYVLIKLYSRFHSCNPIPNFVLIHRYTVCCCSLCKMKKLLCM